MLPTIRLSPGAKGEFKKMRKLQRTGDFTFRMNGHARDFITIDNQLLGQCLLDQIVQANGLFGGHKKVRPRRMELDTLNDVLGLFEGHLRFALGQIVDDHRFVRPVGHDSGKIIARTVPGELSDLVLVLDGQADALLVLV